MARPHLTLAALATVAVPGLDVATSRRHSYGVQGDFESAAITARDGRALIVRVPNSQTAETEQGADLVALAALTHGVRSRLPFDVPVSVGQAPRGDTRAVVYEFLPGDKVALDDVPAHEGLAVSMGRAIAAVHALPSAFVGEAGLPVLTAEECRLEASALIERAGATGKVPSALRDRWQSAVAEEGLWLFQPCVINGTLTVDSFLAADGLVTGVLGWSGLQVGDPAQDVQWLLSMRADAARSALAAYDEGRGGAEDERLTSRAVLYAELEVAKWLLHGRDLHEAEIVDDAVGMLDALVERVHSDVLAPIALPTGRIATVTEVRSLLDASPVRSASPRSGMAPIEEDEGARLREDDDEEL